MVFSSSSSSLHTNTRIKYWSIILKINRPYGLPNLHITEIIVKKKTCWDQPSNFSFFSTVVVVVVVVIGNQMSWSSSISLSLWWTQNKTKQKTLTKPKQKITTTTFDRIFSKPPFRKRKTFDSILNQMNRMNENS